MKVLYSQIKELVPELKASPKKVANILTIIGFMADAFEEVNYQGKKDYLINLEIRQNRGDGQSVIGIAKEVAAYYGLEMKIPFIKEDVLKEKLKSLKIKVEATSVKRILAFKISGLENKKSPLWLINFLDFYEIKSINFLVDLSNYVMILTGFPSHLLDFDKINGNLSWALSSFDKITTFDGACLKLKEGKLIIRDDKNILALAGVIGGETARLDSTTKTIIAEMAVYSDAVIRKDSRDLNTITEASNRLSKRLDPNGLDFAANYLVHLILENFDNALVSESFDYYPEKTISKKIVFNPKLPTILAGIEISEEKSIAILKNLGFKIIANDKNNKIEVITPVNRTDISISDDLAVEVIRIFGYDKISTDKIPFFEITPDITPKKIYLFEKIRDVLSNLGLDETLSLPLVQENDNSKVNYLDLKEVTIENSVNENYPKLRQSLATGLINQFNQYQKKNVKPSGLFEIGKIYGTIDKTKKALFYEDYIENDNLGILMPCENLSMAKETIERTLRQIGLTNIFYLKSKKAPKIANSYSCWDISVKKEKGESKVIGIFYKLSPEFNNLYFGEFNIDKIVEILGKNNNGIVEELIQRLVVLDANIELDKEEATNKVNEFIFKIRKETKEDNLWDIIIIDQFLLETKIRYTLRVSYKNLSDQEAKKLHFKIFNL